MVALSFPGCSRGLDGTTNGQDWLGISRLSSGNVGFVILSSLFRKKRLEGNVGRLEPALISLAQGCLLGITTHERAGACGNDIRY